MWIKCRVPRIPVKTDNQDEIKKIQTDDCNQLQVIQKMLD